MSRPSSPTLTNAERAILDVLWTRKEASVREVADELSKKKPVAYTTVLTMFKVLERKRLVTYRTEGRAFVYCAAITRDAARRQALDNLIGQFFGGSPDVLAQHLISEHDIGLAELQDLQDQVDAAPKRRKRT